MNNCVLHTLSCTVWLNVSNQQSQCLHRKINQLRFIQSLLNRKAYRTHPKGTIVAPSPKNGCVSHLFPSTPFTGNTQVNYVTGNLTKENKWQKNKYKMRMFVASLDREKLHFLQPLGQNPLKYLLTKFEDKSTMTC